MKLHAYAEYAIPIEDIVKAFPIRGALKGARLDGDTLVITTHLDPAVVHWQISSETGEGQDTDPGQPEVPPEREDGREMEKEDQDAPPREQEAAEKRKGGPLATRAGITCAEKAFWTFMEVRTEEAAIAELREHCGVKTRADLDHDEEAGEKFKRLMRDYNNWLRSED